MNAQKQKALSEVTFFPYWLDNPKQPPATPELTENTEADLTIIGGGFTGLWAAILAKKANSGRDILLLEANRVAHGASGRPGGIISTSILHGLTNALRVFPKDLELLERLGHENITELFKTLFEYNIDCHAEWGGELTVAVGKDKLPMLEEEYNLHVKHAHDVELLDRDAVQKEINSPLFYGGIWSRKNCGTVHPALLAWGLKRIAMLLGVRIHENTPMTSLQPDQKLMQVQTPNAVVKTPKVILATNAFASGDEKIKERVAMIHDRIITTEPLSQEQMQSIGWENRQGIYDTRTQLNYMRLTKDNRIIFGGRLGYFDNGNHDPESDKQPKVYIPLANAFFQTFPQLADVKFSHAWSGPIALTTRMAVHFQRYHDNKVVYVGGYSGFGISASRFGAKIALAIIDKSKSPVLKLDLVQTMPKPIPPEPFRSLGAKITMNALDGADEKGGWRKLWLKLVTKMGFPLS